MTKKDVATVVDAAFDKITAAMVAGDKVQIIGFGTFETRERGERTRKNPRTAKLLPSKLAKAPAFKAGKALKNAVSK